MIEVVLVTYGLILVAITLSLLDISIAIRTIKREQLETLYNIKTTLELQDQMDDEIDKIKELLSL